MACLSYDPDYEQWEFGKLSAMREIAFAQENNYAYYYMGQCLPQRRIEQSQLTLYTGFYIHSCVKMRYKGNFRPQYILGERPYHTFTFQSVVE
jgi:arginine-tRNA-protein transferase